MQIARAETPSSAQAESRIGGAFASSPWISETEFAKLRMQPALQAAVAHFISEMIENYKGDRLLNKLVCDRGRILITLFVLYLEVLPVPGTKATGATLSSVQTLCRRTGICSPGRAAAVLAAMRFGGYIASCADPADHRRRLLAPTEKLLAMHMHHWVLQFDAMAPVFPRAALVPPLLQQDAFRIAFLHELGSYFLAGFRVVDHSPLLTELTESNAGLLMMSSLALRQITGEEPAGQTVPVSISALARRFFVSRAHIRNVLTICDQAGLIARTNGAEEIMLLPALSDALIQFYGAMFILFDRCAARAAQSCQ